MLKFSLQFHVTFPTVHICEYLCTSLPGAAPECMLPLPVLSTGGGGADHVVPRTNSTTYKWAGNWTQQRPPSPLSLYGNSSKWVVGFAGRHRMLISSGPPLQNDRTTRCDGARSFSVECLFRAARSTGNRDKVSSRWWGVDPGHV